MTNELCPRLQHNLPDYGASTRLPNYFQLKAVNTLRITQVMMLDIVCQMTALAYYRADDGGSFPGYQRSCQITK